MTLTLVPMTRVVFGNVKQRLVPLLQPSWSIVETFTSHWCAVGDVRHISDMTNPRGKKGK